MVCYKCTKEIHGYYIPVRENMVEIYFCNTGCFNSHYANKDRKTPNPRGGDMWPHDKKEDPKS